jgi:hypothetical protein
MKIKTIRTEAAAGLGQFEAEDQSGFYLFEHQDIVRHQENTVTSVQCAADYGLAETRLDGHQTVSCAICR